MIAGCHQSCYLAGETFATCLASEVLDRSQPASICMWKVRTKEGPVNVEVGWVWRSFLIKFRCLVCLFGFLFHAGLDPHLMTARRGWRSAAAAAERNLKRTRCHANDAAGSGHSTSGAQGQGQKRAVQDCRVEFQASASANSSGRFQGGLRQSEFARSVIGDDSCKFFTSSRCRNEESKADQERQEKNPWL